METTTFVAGLRVDDVMTLFVIDRAMTGAIFGTYIERGLVPTLAPGDILSSTSCPPTGLSACVRRPRWRARFC